MTITWSAAAVKSRSWVTTTTARVVARCEIQCNRMRGDTGANGDGGPDQHLANGDVFEKERLPNQHTAALEECRVRHFTALFRAGITRNGMWTAAPRQCFLCDR